MATRFDVVAAEYWRSLPAPIAALSADLAELEASSVTGGGSGVASWTPYAAYTAGQVVSQANGLYRAKTALTSGASFDPALWDALVVPGASGSAVNVQRADGSWTLNKAAVDAAHATGSSVLWYTRASQPAPTAVNGLAVGDVLDGVINTTETLTFTTVGTAPTAQDASGVANDTVTLTRAAGVTYTVDGVDHAYASFPGSTKVVPYTKGTNTTVTAKPETGYTLTGTTSWALLFSNVTVTTGTVITTDTFSGGARTVPAGTSTTTDAVNGGTPKTVTITGTAEITASGTLKLTTAGAKYRLDNTLTSSTAEARIVKLPTTGQLDFYPAASGEGVIKIAILPTGSSRIWFTTKTGSQRDSGTDIYVQAGDVVRGTKNGPAIKYEVFRGGSSVGSTTMTATAAEDFTPTAYQFIATAAGSAAEIDDVKLTAG